MTLEDARRELFPAFEQVMRDTLEGKSVTPFSDGYLNELLEAYKKGVSERQIHISFNKWLHGFNVTNPTIDMSCLVGEVAEVMEAQAKGDLQEMAYELADVAIHCYGIVQMIGFDLDKAIAHKMQDFFGRTYHKDVEV